MSTADLVDYLRDKLDHADDAVCSCPDIDVSTCADQARGEWPTVKGLDRDCPLHGANGSERRTVQIIDPIGEVGFGRRRVFLWPDNWVCGECHVTGPNDEGNRAAWDHVVTHVPKSKRWWRR